MRVMVPAISNELHPFSTFEWREEQDAQQLALAGVEDEGDTPPRRAASLSERRALCRAPAMWAAKHARRQQPLRCAHGRRLLLPSRKELILLW